MIESIKTAEANLVNAIATATEDLHAVGGPDLSLAILELQTAATVAQQRLANAAATAKAVLHSLAASLAGIAETLSAEIAEPASPVPVATAQQPTADEPAPAATPCTPDEVVREVIDSVGTGEGWSVEESTQPLPLCRGTQTALPLLDDLGRVVADAAQDSARQETQASAAKKHGRKKRR